MKTPLDPRSARLPRHVLGLAFCLVLAIPPLHAAEDIITKGRQVFDQRRHAIVTVQLVVRSKFSFSGMADEARESNEEVTGTVIDPGGLTVLALSSTDPAGLVQSMMSGMGGGDDESQFKMESELGDVKLLTHDGTEIPAEVVLRDRDLDLVFIRPKTKPSEPMLAVDLADSSPVQILDQVITINRLGRVAGRAYAASLERIHAVVERPRKFYVPGGDVTTTGMGSPAFTADGKLVGVFVMRSLKSGGAGSLLGLMPSNISPILLPADEIRKIAQQVPAAKN
jgi:S1-C subfamily serine protease